MAIKSYLPFSEGKFSWGSDEGSGGPPMLGGILISWSLEGGGGGGACDTGARGAFEPI